MRASGAATGGPGEFEQKGVNIDTFGRAGNCEQLCGKHNNPYEFLSFWKLPDSAQILRVAVVSDFAIVFNRFLAHFRRIESIIR
jgi:hypothetical protein